jgi:hypothetical protein
MICVTSQSRSPWSNTKGDYRISVSMSQDGACQILNKYKVWHKITLLNTLLLENLAVAQLVKTFSTHYGTRRFIIVFTTPATGPILSQTNPVHTLPSCYFKIDSHLRLGLSSGHFLPNFPMQPLRVYILFHVYQMPHPKVESSRLLRNASRPTQSTTLHGTVFKNTDIFIILTLFTLTSGAIH